MRTVDASKTNKVDNMIMTEIARLLYMNRSIWQIIFFVCTNECVQQ